MKYFILSGSHRADSQSLKVAHFIRDLLTAGPAKAEVHVCSLSGNPLPLWSEEHGGIDAALWDPIAAELKSSDALVIISPEWSGMATPGVKNFLLNCGADEVGHKPALIVTVSATRGGSYPVAELRMSGYKNNRIVWLPEHVIVQHAPENLNATSAGSPLTKEDAYLRERLHYSLALLTEYGRALGAVRASGVIDHGKFRNGM